MPRKKAVYNNDVDKKDESDQKSDADQKDTMTKSEKKEPVKRRKQTVKDTVKEKQPTRLLKGKCPQCGEKYEKKYCDKHIDLHNAHGAKENTIVCKECEMDVVCGARAVLPSFIGFECFYCQIEKKITCLECDNFDEYLDKYAITTARLALIDRDIGIRFEPKMVKGNKRLWILYTIVRDDIKIGKKK